MPRAVDATLAAALAAGAPFRYIRGSVAMTDGSGLITADVLNYKLTGTSLTMELPTNASFGSTLERCWLERGLTIAGVNYSVTTGKFFISSQRYLANGHQIVSGTLFPNQYFSIPGDDTYQNIITAFCANFGKTAVFKDAGAAWLAYKMLPVGKFIIPRTANAFLNLIRQKYLIFACDYGAEQIRFYHAGLLNIAADENITVNADFWIEDSHVKNRQFTWIDEAGTTHYDGDATDPIHNLGYLESTASPPVRHTPSGLIYAETRPDLSIIDGDVVQLNFFQGAANAKYFAQVTEEFSAGSKTNPPTWRIIAAANPIFDTTEAGAIISPTSGPPNIGAEGVLPYTPLNATNFGVLLSARDSNLQTAMETLDGHVHPPIPSIGSWFELTKIADQDVINSTTLTNDTELNFSVNANQVQHIEVYILYSGNSLTNDMKVAFGCSAGTLSGWHRLVGQDNASNAVQIDTGTQADAVNPTAVTVLGTDASDTVRVAFFEAMLQPSSSGTLSLMFAENSAAAGKHARMKKGSVLRYRNFKYS